MRVSLPGGLAAVIVPFIVCAAFVPATAGIVEFRQDFLAAAAAPATDPSLYASQRRKLDGYVLAPYLDYAQLRRTLPGLGAGAARTFMESEADTQLGAQFRRDYLAELARRGDWPGFMAFDDKTADGSPVLRCHRVRALLAGGRGKAARREITALWATGQSLPDACDPPIASARERDWITTKLIWQRLRLAVEARNAGLASYLARQLPDREREEADRLVRAAADPDASLKLAAQWPDGPLYREATTLALKRRARAAIDSAITHWQVLAPRFDFSVDERAGVLHDLALYAAADFRPDAGDWFEQVPVEARSEQLVEWQLRAALAAQNWIAVLKIADGRPEGIVDAPGTRYWRARALGELRRDAEARAGYQALALEANFHGFLAADQLVLPYAICPKDVAPDAARAQSLRSQVDVARALELHAVGWRVEAARAWDHARQGLSDADQKQLLLLASEQGWFDRVVFALSSGDDLRHYALRFPVAERDTVEREAAVNGLDPAWTYALIRAESAWQPDVRSHANAYGLMQLLPGTGQLMARQLGIPWRGTSMLLEPATNIQLGTRYLAQQAEKFAGSPWLASAAYNAGPTPVQRWLTERDALPADIFIETIPYRETREYVARVLAFSVIYDWRLNGTARPISSRLPAPGQRITTKLANLPARPVVCPTADSG